MDIIYSVVTVFTNVIDPSLSSMPVSSVVECVNLCFRGTNCASFFYDLSLGLCYQSDMLYTAAPKHGLTAAQNVDCYEWRHDDCSYPWSFSKTTGMCLQFFQTGQRNTDARQTCVDNGGRLVKIDNEKKHSLIRKIMLLDGKGIWIGLGKATTWTWHLGGELGSFKSWAPRHPEPGEYCGVMGSFTKNWNTIPCSSTRRLPCERVLNLTENCNI